MSSTGPPYIPPGQISTRSSLPTFAVALLIPLICRCIRVVIGASVGAGMLVNSLRPTMLTMRFFCLHRMDPRWKPCRKKVKSSSFVSVRAGRNDYGCPYIPVYKGGDWCLSRHARSLLIPILRCLRLVSPSRLGPSLSPPSLTSSKVR